ncbi:Alpha/Beta hydrolase protein [Xylogone sp. PMI_703]|nr:Alpha/Beta hydrolase protein [Xylogone sp. PMI_703]
MIFFIIQLVALSLLSFAEADTGTTKKALHPFTIDLSKNVPRMVDLINNTQLPPKPEYPGLGSSYGISFDTVKEWQTEWLTSYNWDEDQEYLNNKFNHFITTIESLNIHFIYEKSKSKSSGVIPLILLHGWPGSFLEFLPVIEQLTQPARLSNGKTISFDVIVPSLPGFAFSSAPPANWTVDDTARVFNSLMIDVLGYDKFAVHGTDWGGVVGYSLYEKFNLTTRAAHVTFLPFFPLEPDQLASENITLSPLEQFEEEVSATWSVQGEGYYYEQTYKANTIGLALYDNPMGQLVWMGEKFLNWSDPRAGTAPSVLNSNAILRSVSLYYLTRSFVSAAFLYAQNPGGFRTEYSMAQTDAPLLFSAFKYNMLFWPPELVQRVGNLVNYKNHDFGGHFAGLDNPPALIEDVREIGTYWL